MLCRPTAAGTASAPTGSGGFRSLNWLSGLVSAAASTFGMRMLFCRDGIGSTATRATAAATIMPAEELLDLLGRSIVDFLDSADEVEVFACQGVVEVEYDDFFLDLEDATTDDLPVGRVQGQRSTFDDQSIELAFAVDEDLTGQLLDSFFRRLAIGIFALEDEVELVPCLEAEELLLEGGQHHTHALDVLQRTVGGGLLHQDTLVLITDVQLVVECDELIRCYRHNLHYDI